MYVDRHIGRHKPLYTHYTCATDTENIKVVFKAVKDTLLQDNLERFGLEWRSKYKAGPRPCGVTSDTSKDV